MAGRRRNWCITQFNFEQWDASDVHLRPDFRYLVYQTETCEKTGRPHQQAYVEFKKALHFGVVKAIFGNDAHLEGRRGTRDEARKYCMKEDTRMPGTEPIELGEWVDEAERGENAKREDLNEARTRIQQHTSWAAVLLDKDITDVVCRYKSWAREIYDNRPVDIPVPDITLYEWQAEILDILDAEPTPRRVIWIWSHASGTGKSTFYDFCCSKFNVLPCVDYANTLYAYDGQAVLWFDLSRQNTHEKIPYDAIERFSNQTVHLSSKYTSCRKRVTGHVVVTANMPPDEVRLPNRCKVYHIDPQNNV